MGLAACFSAMEVVPLTLLTLDATNADDRRGRPMTRPAHRIRTTAVAIGVGAMTIATSTLAQPASDHLACYLVKDPVHKGTSTVTITDAGVTQSCTVASRAQLGCLKTQTPTCATSSATDSSAPSLSRPQHR